MIITAALLVIFMVSLKLCQLTSTFNSANKISHFGVNMLLLVDILEIYDEKGR